MLVTLCDYQTLHNQIVNLFMNRKCANFVLSGLLRAPSLIYFGILFYTWMFIFYSSFVCSYLFSLFFLVCVYVCFSIKFCGHQLNIDPRLYIAYCSFSMTERVRALYLVSSSNLIWVLRLEALFPITFSYTLVLSVVTLHNQIHSTLILLIIYSQKV